MREKTGPVVVCLHPAFQLSISKALQSKTALHLIGAAVYTLKTSIDLQPVVHVLHIHLSIYSSIYPQPRFEDGGLALLIFNA